MTRIAAAAAALSLIALLPLRAQPAPPADAVEILDGVDPVLLLRGQEVPGKEALSAVHDGYRYLFASPETKAEFEKDPARYEPAFGGTCARMGARTGGSTALFAVHEGHIYLFGADDCLRRFQASPARFLPHPPAEAAATPQARARGRELLELAARAAGGAARLDALAGWRVETARTISSPNGPATQTQIVTVALPDRVREERRAAFGTVINVAGPAGAFGLFVAPDGQAGGDDRRAPAQRRALGEALQGDAARGLLALLRARRDEGVTAAALGATSVGGVAAEGVAVRTPRAAVRLDIDPASGRVLRESYHDRGPEGAYGEIALTLSDYRDAGGLTLPHAVAASFDGQPAPALGYTVTSWTLDPPLDPAAFLKPAPPAPAPRP